MLTYRYKTKDTLDDAKVSLFSIGDPNGIRTHEPALRGLCLNRLTMGPSGYI